LRVAAYSADITPPFLTNACPGLLGFALHSNGEGYGDLNLPFKASDDNKPITRGKSVMGHFGSLTVTHEG